VELMKISYYGIGASGYQMAAFVIVESATSLV
jgi:hypothetical protein